MCNLAPAAYKSRLGPNFVSFHASAEMYIYGTRARKYPAKASRAADSPLAIARREKIARVIATGKKFCPKKVLARVLNTGENIFCPFHVGVVRRL